MRVRLLFILALIITSCNELFADTGPLGYGNKEFTSEMETDRPDFTEGTQSIDSGHLQTETGYTYYHDTEDAHVLPELLERIGVYENFELRIGWEGYIAGENNNSGTSDMSLGFKQEVWHGESVNFSYILATTLPVGSRNQTSDELQPGIKILWDHDLTDLTSIAGNINLASISEEDERYLQPSASITIGHDLTDAIGCYAEYFGFYPEGGEAKAVDEHYMNGGLTWAYTTDIQLDLRAGLGLNSDAADLFSGLGFSWRI